MEKTDSKDLSPEDSAALLKMDLNAATLYDIVCIINHVYRKEGRKAAVMLMAEITGVFFEQGFFVEYLHVEPEVSQDEPCRFTAQVRDKKTGKIVPPPKDADPPVPITFFDPVLNRMSRIAMRPDGTPGYVRL